MPINGLIKKFPNVYQFCNEDINKFVLLLRKGVYPYEYMDSWERFNEISLLDKEAFNNELNLEDCTDEDYAHYKKMFKEFELKNLGDYRDLYVQCDTLLLADVFGNFREKCMEIYGLDPAHFLSAPGLAWQACLKKTEVKLELLTDPDMYNKYMGKKYDKNIELSYLMCLEANNLYGWAMSQKLPIDGFKWLEDLPKFNESFIKNYYGKSNKDIFLK